MSKQQTLFNFLHLPKSNGPRGENENATLQPPQNPTNWKPFNQDNLDGNPDENLEDDVLLAACENWEENTFNSHSPSENGRTSNNKPSPSYQESPGTSRQSFQQTFQEPVQQTVPEATQLEDLPGFDVSTGNIWIYPTNYPLREYQFNIAQQALFKNTMVSLPTGLGKTFVAAVVMYNFYRWYPEGKVVFMAPTKPLVAQQIEACHNVMGIMQSDMAEMTGNMPPPERQKAWTKCRVFFLTPQVLMNDLSRRACPAQQVKCLVVDEAHKALGNHAYCQVVRELAKYSNSFRVLALSATPGSDLKAIQQVLTNLLISHIEIRSEDSIDIRPYVHERKVEKVVVPLDQELKSVRDKYLRLLSMYVSRLNNSSVLLNKDPATLTKFQILQSRDAFRQDPPPQAKSRGLVEGDFALCISLYHGYELLLQHGLRSLCNFLQSTVDGAKGFSRTRQELMRNEQFVQLLRGLKEKFGSEDGNDGANRSCLFSLPGTQRVKEMKPYVTSHPKMAKLQEIVLEHFRKFDAEKASPNTDQPSTNRGQQTRPSSTRVMIFAQYRDSVNEIVEMLKRHRPQLRCMGFVGQSSVGKNTKGISQKEQLRVVKEFREGGYNTLVCTCVGEEGLDIGDVDLIVCYDAHKSPIRLVQRMGRTGRKRQGRIVMLVTEGKEAAVYDRSQYNKKGIVKALQGNAKSLQLYPNNPRMVPRGLNPTPHKMFISVEAFVNKKDAKLKSSAVARKSNETGLESFMAKGKSSKKGGEFLSPEELGYWSASYKLTAAESEALPSMPEKGKFVTLGAAKDTQNLNGKSSRPKMSLTEWSPWQMNKQPVRFVEHSQRCKHFVELMEFIDLQNLTEGDDIYGMEMQTYLNEEDIVRPKKRGIEQFCTVRAKTGASVKLPKKDGSRESTPSRKGSPDEFLEGLTTAQPGLGTKKQKSEIVDLTSISSDSFDSDDVLPAVLQENNKQQTHSEIRNSTITSTGPKKSELNKKTEKVKNADATKLSKPRKHKQKKKHLSPVLDSSDDDDFAVAKKCNKFILGDKKTPSPSTRTKDQDGVNVLETNDVNVEADVFRPRKTDKESKSPEPMDVDSDNFVSPKNNEASNSVPSENPSNSPVDKTEEDLSFLFPTQTSFITPVVKDDNLKPNLKKGKSLVPPPPPLTFSSLDLLDDIDTTFNLTQHFQTEASSFGNTRKKDDYASKLSSFEEVLHDDTKSPIFQKSQTLNLSPLTSVEKMLPAASTKKHEKVSNAESSALTSPCEEEVQISTTDDILEPTSPFRPQFDLNVDFMILSSSDDESEAPVIPTSDIMPSPPSPDRNSNEINKDSIMQNPYMENEVSTPQVFEMQTPQAFDVETPQAFDSETPQVQTPQLESTLKDPSSSTRVLNNSLHTLVPSTKESVQSKTITSPRKTSASALLDTPKSGLETGTESRMFARLRDKQKDTISTDRTQMGPKRSLNLKSQGSLNPTTSSQQTQAFHTEDPAGIEKARLDVLGSTEPQFDLGFDLDSLEDDDIDENDIIPPSPNPKQQQEYISLSQKAKLHNQSSSFSSSNVWTRTSSTPVLTAQSHQETKTYSDLLSPITADGMDWNNTAHGEHLNKVSMSQSKSLSLSKRRLSIESFPSPKQKPENSPKSLEGDVVSELVDGISTPSVHATKHLSPSGTNIHLPNKKDVDSRSREKLSLRKRKSSPFPDGCSTDVKRRRSEPSPPLTEPGDAEFCNEGAEEIQMRQRTGTLVNFSEVIDLDADEDDSPENKDLTKHCMVQSDEDDDPFSQVVQPRKRRKAVALKSPQTPIFKTPNKPSMASYTKTTPAKPVISSSDDEPESPFIHRSKKPRQILTMDEEEDNDFVDYIKKNEPRVGSMVPFNSRPIASCAITKQPVYGEQKRPKRARFASGHGRGFVEEEADVSYDEECSSDEEGSELDSSLDGFISHGSQPTQAMQSALTADDMHAVYMQSVRSPNDGGVLHPSRNRFRMVPREIPEDLDIFSQVPMQDANYYENSFVVHEEDVSDGKWRDGEKNLFEESLFENTINPDNILASRRRPRREGISRAKQILKEGRRRVLKSSSSASTSAEETDEDLRTQNKIPTRETRNFPAASASKPNENASAGWLVAEERQKLATNGNLLINGRTSVPAEYAHPLARTEELACRNYVSSDSKLFVSDKMGHQGNTFPNEKPASLIKQFLAGSSRKTNSCPDDFLNHRKKLQSNNSDRMCTEFQNDGLTVAERERAERLRRQEGKKREFMRKMEESKRLLQLNRPRPKQQETACIQQDGYRPNKMQEWCPQVQQQNYLQHEFNPSAQLQQQHQQQQHQQQQHRHEQQEQTADQCLNVHLQNDDPNLSNVPSSSVKISIEYTSGGIPTREPVNPALKGTGDDKSPRMMPVRSSPLLSPSSVQLMNRPTLAGSQDAMCRGKPVILIDSKELSSASHIVSTLNLKHNLNPLVCPLTGCDYIVSSRMGVEKRTLSDFGNGANRTKLIDRMRHLCELFDRPCLILERDRVKPGDNTRPRLIRTKYFDGNLAALSKTHIKILYSDSLEDTAKILADLVRIEARKGEGLPQPRPLDPTQEQVLKMYLTLPRVSYATALSLLAAFPSVERLINSSPEELHQKARISHQRAAEIVSFFHHQFDEQMTSLGTTH